MSKYIRHRICRHCYEPFLPNWRNRNRQFYCLKPQCRKASKRHSFKVWIKKNPDHYKGKAGVIRVQQWREKNPNYSKKAWAKTKAKKAMPVTCPTPVNGESKVKDGDLRCQMGDALHNSIIDNPLITALVAEVYQCALPNSIEVIKKRLVDLGLELQSRIPGGLEKRSAKGVTCKECILGKR